MISNQSEIDPKSEIDEGVTIGPWCIIGPGVRIGAGTLIESHVVIRANTRIGTNNRFYQFCSVGENPADKKFEGEETWLEIGSDNVFREGVTLHRGTGAGGGCTKIGDDNLMMAYGHVAHDCTVGSHTVFANNVGLCGHVVIDDWAILGGYAGVNQFLTVGAHAMIGGMTHVSNDVPAYMIVSGRPATVRSVNTIGLERRGFDKESIAEIREAFKILYKRNYSLQEALDQIRVLSENCAPLTALVASLESSKKGIHR
ncbi:MAG: acyl-[acyl-carrier-protein]--UDP-N-acetylglucosamine O-acyltransferase [Gammaproteobacteria bacterium]|nr:acyl-[acyl-carrier-protein]--UDP-N-acetylglucosamine O-acyltransferase [Gammaproteobacteria bacterium]HBW83614.1 acyl-[acyl-carrier-protein]--UDP-N-acetylglucosamine O-acyltransferase [Gammaproteobacteria bacterium]|tara:strand:+ start:1567 stop:2337 length:771 start_codon:yes stop_codon:yes gene_type:complete